MDTLSWPAAATRFLALRLPEGAPLRESLQEAFDAQPEEGGFLAAAVGSLVHARLRPAGLTEPRDIIGDLEIMTLSGTFSADGPHLHLAVANADGRMTGGHLLDGSVVRTTAEVVIALAGGVRFTRPEDPGTGLRELAFE
ncbi:hypothetical protein BCF33_0920 [Hasllibacter halocynthiae]|uniref:PPC domain-containing protein n=1 Tax=Hasllibacter halocynthiae TaxID=595589 RepID=A0A2T0X8M5_9RHOB|nr:PPC domain-containing DNA-binding protein [Hasllibacter halocynthiae]PRY95302.1 hypothetical protein BCF33_0920 [Hasllibacter halocynthiae]